jgi:hypothetical protein
VRDADKRSGPYKGRDAFIIIEGEKRQFEKSEFTKFNRFVENIYSGDYNKVKRDFNPNLQRGPVTEE